MKNTANSAHAAGKIVGMLTGWAAFRKPATVTDRRYHNRCAVATLFQRGWLAMTAALACATLGNVSVLASDTWTGAGPGDIWSSALNWSTGAPPVVNDDVIMLGPGHTTNFANIGGPFPTWTLNTLQFPSGAPAFDIHIISMTITGGPGAGVINDSGVTQTLDVDPGNSFTPTTPGVLNFDQSAVAGAVQINDNGGTAVGGGGPKEGGSTTFKLNSSAGQATINNTAAQVSPVGSAFATAGKAFFQGSSTAGSAAINNFGGTLDVTEGGSTEFSGSSNAGIATIRNMAASGTNAFGGKTSFTDNSMAGSATITNDGTSATGFFAEGFTDFGGTSSAENATINNNGGTAATTSGGVTQFDTNATAGNATIVNNGGAVNFALSGETLFSTGASAGNATITNNGGFLAAGGVTKFFGGSAANATINNNAATNFRALGGQTIFNGGTAGNATINNNGSAIFDSNANFEPAGITFFHGTSSAGSAMIFNNGGTNGFAAGGQTIFDESSAAGNATITNNGGTDFLASGGETIFSASSDANNATLIANAGTGGSLIRPGGFGGSIQFLDSSTGGTARVEVFGNGNLDISGHSAPGVTIGSIEGSGFVSLGANNLSVGSNNLSTTFSGVAQDGGFSGGTGGSLTKIGTGTLTLSGANTYTGATAVNAGKLLVDGSIASSSGVAVAAGATLGGHGNVSAISGAGTVAPGNSPGILTATHLDPSGGMGFLFDFMQAGSPTYSNASASGNDLLRLTDTSPFTTAFTSSNQITVDFSGASLAAGELYRGGFFTDSATATSVVSNANFLYTGTGGFTVQFDGFVTESAAAFASGTVLNGTVLQFDISGSGTSVPDASSTWTLLLLSLAATFGLNLLLRRQCRRK
jgi:autotransporter-associated beta strand protein